MYSKHSHNGPTRLAGGYRNPAGFTLHTADYEAYLPVFRTRIVISAILSAACSDDFRYFVAVTRIEQVSQEPESCIIAFILNGNVAVFVLPVPPRSYI